MIPIYEPFIGAEEEQLVLDCVRSSWISSLGTYLGLFEQEFAARCGSRYAVTVSSGTAALHLILHGLGIGPGDEVLVPTLTFVATANAVTYTGATPVFCEARQDTWNISIIDAAQRVTERTKAIIVVHLFGQPCRMNEVLAFAERHNLLVIEDAAEAHFARIDERCVGTFGSAAAFSLYGNKIITTGEGGMITTDDEALAGHLRHLRDHAMSPVRRYWHDQLGFNYRMTNVQAAIGVAQLRKVETILHNKAQIASWYRGDLAEVAGVVLPPLVPHYHHAHWLFSILLDDSFRISRDALMAFLREQGVETRPFFEPLHTLPMYSSETQPALPIAEGYSRRGLSLPSAPNLIREQVQYITSLIAQAQRTGP